MVMVVVVVSLLLAVLVAVSAVAEGLVEGLLVPFDGVLVVGGGADGADGDASA